MEPPAPTVMACGGGTAVTVVVDVAVTGAAVDGAGGSDRVPSISLRLHHRFKGETGSKVL
jgi:hypothetical protein